MKPISVRRYTRRRSYDALLEMRKLGCHTQLGRIRGIVFIRGSWITPDRFLRFAP